MKVEPIRILRGSALLSPACVLAACLAASPVAADTAVSHHGLIGVHYLADFPEYAGARCRYNGDQ